jgi:tRNA A37 methylthiotransferase MiaB
MMGSPHERAHSSKHRPTRTNAVAHTRRIRLTQQADVVLAVTCAIRENAERKVWQRLDLFRLLKRRRAKDTARAPLQIGVLGCMAGACVNMHV